MREKNIYLAGAIGCYGNNQANATMWRFDAEESIKRHVVSYDGVLTKWNVIDPCDYYMYGEGLHHTEKEVMGFDLNRVNNSDVILVNLNDLDKSIGTSDEILYAYLHSIPVIGFLQTDEVLQENETKELLHPWKYEQINRIETGLDALEKAVDYICTYYRY